MRRRVAMIRLGFVLVGAAGGLAAAVLSTSLFEPTVAFGSAPWLVAVGKATVTGALGAYIALTVALWPLDYSEVEG